MTTSMGSGIFPMLLMLGMGLVCLAAWAGSLAWVWRDANRRGQPGFIVTVLVAFLCWPVSLLVWVAARPSVPGTVPGKSSRGCVWALVLVVAIGIIALTIGIGILLPICRMPAVGKAREAAERTECMSHVRQIALAYVSYSGRHSRSPVTLSDLDMNPACPSARRRSLPPRLTPAGFALVSYELLPGSNATDIIVREMWENHGGKGGAVAFGDGHVEWVDSPYKPLRLDVVRAGVERKLRQQLGDEFISVEAVTFDARANRYDVNVHLKVDGQEYVTVMELRQDGVGIANYAGTLVIRRRQDTLHCSLYVDQLMERQEALER